MAGLIDSTLEMAGTVKNAAGDAYNSAMNTIFGENPAAAGRTLGKGVEKILGYRIRKDAGDKNAPAVATGTNEKTFNVLEYPTGCALSQPHMKISVFEYKRNRREASLKIDPSREISTAEQKVVNPLYTIVLPITQSIVSSFDHVLTDLEGVGNAFDDLGGKLGAAAAEGSGYETYTGIIGGASVATAATGAAKIMMGKIGGSNGLAGTLAQQAGRSAGLALNPVTEVAYTQPSVRAHAFEFTMIPKNAEETSSIQKIISTLTSSSLPTEVANTFGLILNYPYICEVTFHIPNNGGRIPGVLGIPDAFIQNVTFVTNPVGGGRLMTDGTPVSYKLSISFKELKAMTREDYNTLLNESGTFTSFGGIATTGTR